MRYKLFQVKSSSVVEYQDPMKQNGPLSKFIFFCHSHKQETLTMFKNCKNCQIFIFTADCCHAQ